MHIYLPGTRISQYEVISRPMMGGMGVVYICRDTEADRPVALKTFKPEYLSDRAARDRFLREGTAWVDLGSHPHVVRCHEVFYQDPLAFLVLELIAKEPHLPDASLRPWLVPGSPLTVEQALLFAIQIARGLEHAVGQLHGFVHRDLKPENVLVGVDKIPDAHVNRLRVTDFGLAKVVKEIGTEIPSTGGVTDAAGDARYQHSRLTRGAVGTPPYMAPEQWLEEPVGIYTDVYALGCILYEMLAGQRVVAGRTTTALQDAHVRGNLRPLPDDLPVQVRSILQRCLARQAQDRYQTWQEVIAALALAYTQVSGKPVPPPPLLEETTQGERLRVGWSYSAMGLSYLDLGQSEAAKEYFERAWLAGRTEKDAFLEASGMASMGMAYSLLGDSQQAIQYIEQALPIFRKQSSLDGEGAALGDLGSIYLRLGDFRKAIACFEQSLAMLRQARNRGGIGTVLGNLGIAHRNMGDFRRAIDYFDESLTIDLEMGDRRGEANALGNLGIAYFELGDMPRSIDYHQRALAIHHDLGDRMEEGNDLGELAMTYLEMGDITKSLQYREQALTISREIKDRRGEGNSLGELGIIYYRLEDYSKAITYHQQHLEIMREIGDRGGEASALGNMGAAYMMMQDADPSAVEKVMDCFEQSLAIRREIGDAMGIAATSYNFALLLEKQGSYSRALGLVKEAGEIWANVGSPNVQRARGLAARLQSELDADANPVQAAFDAFQQANSLDEMQQAVSHYPFMIEPGFITAIEQAMAQQVPTELKPAFEQHLAILRQIAGR